MENATKALLIAAGVLIAIIIITVLIITFQKSGKLSKTYDKTVTVEEVTKFNSNFTKYQGEKITIHEAITVTNFAKSNGVNVTNGKTASNIEVNNKILERKYSIEINDYDEYGYINSISIIG